MELTSGLDIVRAAKEIGDPQIIKIDRPEGFETSYKRKGDAVESNRTVRMRQGVYHPSIFTTVLDHRTSTEVKKGSSVGTGGTIIKDAKPSQQNPRTDIPI